MSPNGGMERTEQYDKKFDLIEERMNGHATKIDRHDLILQGDGVDIGLRQRMKNIEARLEKLEAFCEAALFYLKMFNTGGRLLLVGIVTIIGTMWWPWLQPWLQSLIKLISP